MTQKADAGQKKASARVVANAPDAFNMQQYVTEVLELGHSQLALDLDTRIGLIRTINSDHSNNHIQQDRASPPMVIDITTALDEGVLTTRLPCCNCLEGLCVLVWVHCFASRTLPDAPMSLPITGMGHAIG